MVIPGNLAVKLGDFIFVPNDGSAIGRVYSGGWLVAQIEHNVIGTQNMTLLIQDRIRSVINNYDPRVEFKNFKIEKDESVLDGSSIIATIEYAIFGASSNITETSSMTDGIVITIEGPSNG